jgi:hypothetical protein
VLTVPTVAAARTVCASLIDRGYGINQTGLLVPESVSIPALVGEGVPTTAIKLTGSPGVVAAGHIAAGALGRANTVAAALTAIGVSAAAARRYEGDVREGSILISVSPRTARDANHFIRVLSFDPHGTGGGEDE